MAIVWAIPLDGSKPGADLDQRLTARHSEISAVSGGYGLRFRRLFRRCLRGQLFRRGDRVLDVRPKS